MIAYFDANNILTPEGASGADCLATLVNRPSKTGIDIFHFIYIIQRFLFRLVHFILSCFMFMKYLFGVFFSSFFQLNLVFATIK